MEGRGTQRMIPAPPAAVQYPNRIQLSARAATRQETHGPRQPTAGSGVAGGFPRPRRKRQFLARGRGPRHRAARVQPPHPRAGGLGGRRAVRPQCAPGHPHGGGAALPPAAGRRARAAGGGADQGLRGAGPGGGEPALRGDARAVAHVLSALARGTGVAVAAGADPDDFRQLPGLRGPGPAAARAVRAMPRPCRRAGSAG